MPKLRTPRPPSNGQPVGRPTARPADVVIYRDCNERKRMRFPGTLRTGGKILRVGVEEVALIATSARRPVPAGILRVRGWGDYCAAGFERTASVETKRSLRELEANMRGAAAEVRRYYRALDALARNVQHPYLCLNLRVEDLFLPRTVRERLGVRADPEALLDKLALDCAERRIGVVGPWSASRASPYHAGSLVLRVCLLPWMRLRGRHEK